MDYGNYTKGVSSIVWNWSGDYWATVTAETKSLNAEMTVKFRGSGNAYNETSLTTYSIDGASNYTMKLLPSIESVSHATGYTTGG